MAALTYHRGKVLFLSRPMRFLLIVVEHGTASRWWELFGRVGTHWLFLLAFCSLERHRKKCPHHARSLILPTRPLFTFNGCLLHPCRTPDSCGPLFPGFLLAPVASRQGEGHSSPGYELAINPQPWCTVLRARHGSHRSTSIFRGRDTKGRLFRGLHTRKEPYTEPGFTENVRQRIGTVGTRIS